MAYVANDPINKVDPNGEQAADFIMDQRNAALASFAKDNPAVAVAAGAAVAVAVAAEIGGLALANPVAATEIATAAGEFAMGDAAGAGVLGGLGAAGAAASGLGDLTKAEVAKIQSVVNEAGRPLSVVGSAAEGARRGVGSDLPIGKGPGTKSDIDFMATPSSADHFSGLEGQLPGIDPQSGIIVGVPNEHIGPSIQFDPEKFPD